MASPLPGQPLLRPGAVFHYAYLWHREYLLGRTEGLKDRPTLALAVSVNVEDARNHVLALPITHSAPMVAHHGIRIPNETKLILGLDDSPSFVITTEAARFAWPGADVRMVPGRTTPIYGFVSNALLRAIAQSYLANRQRAETVSFDRYD